MTSLKTKVYQLSGWLSGACIVAITILLLLQIIGRMFGFIVPSAEDFAGFALAASTFFGLAYTFREGGHIRVTLVIQRFGRIARQWQERGVLVLAVLLSAAIAYACCFMVYESYIYEEVSYGYVPVPLWIPQVPVALGASALLLATCDALWQSLNGQVPDYMKYEDELGEG
ncbi:TRAP transporter small permease [Marinomonas ostreistagni]|uniref:TRAP transporter small permease protein n=1 Tax=Marinomonas ostreistagni TaxID=359209 RepID=A0ABS0ZG25_9GAMM|nr:TRAP transporter small permease [Marinomonas ostreistagni]MBJ7552363.1 TRAP transporter small permease [Marinomonas ostreistagni]